MKTQKESKGHTPTPWFVHEKNNDWIMGYGDRIAVLDDPSHIEHTINGNAQFIVRAVNSHDTLLSALKVAKAIILKDIDETEADCCQIDDAIKQAEEK
jgi:hypothetical protein